MNVYGINFDNLAETQRKIGQVMLEKGWHSPDFKILADLVEQHNQEVTEQAQREQELPKAA